MTDDTTKTMQDSMRAIVDMAPESPDLPMGIAMERRSRPIVAFATAFAAVLLVVGLGTVALTQRGNESRFVGSGESPSTTVAAVEDGRASPLRSLPMLGIDLPGWIQIEATEDDSAKNGALQSVSYYLPGEQGVSTIAKLRLQNIPVGAPRESDYLWLDNAAAEELTIRGNSVRMIEEQDWFNFAWRESPDAVVQLIIFPMGGEVSRDTAMAVAESVTELSPDTWAEYLATYIEIPASPTTTLGD